MYDIKKNIVEDTEVIRQLLTLIIYRKHFIFGLFGKLGIRIFEDTKEVNRSR